MLVMLLRANDGDYGNDDDGDDHNNGPIAF